MKQELRKIFLLSLFACIGQMIYAYDFEVDGFYYTKLSENTVKLTCDQYKGGSFSGFGFGHRFSSTMPKYSGNVIIPASVSYGDSSYQVVSIDEGVFYKCSEMVSVKIPDGIMSIGGGAFNGCSSLTSIILPNGLTSIGDYAFKDCGCLASITFPKGITTIGGYAFAKCSGLTSVTVLGGNFSIGNGAFSECNGLAAVYISDLKAWCRIDFGEANSNPLYYAHNLYIGDTPIKSLEIPAGVSTIKDYSFFNCRNLESIILPDGINSIGKRAFWRCSALSSITIPDGVGSIGESAFKECDGLVSISLPKSVTEIGCYAFQGCSGLATIVIPAGVTSIHGNTFSNCKGLTSITISMGVTTIGDWAFSGCTGLTSVTIPTSVVSIGASAFSDCTGLTAVTIPASVVSIGASAFQDCTGLTFAVIPSGCTSIGSGAFRGCSGLKQMIIPKGVASIEENTFRDCKGLVSVYIPDGVTSIEGWAFSGCTGLTSIAFPASVVIIGSCAFGGCRGLTSITIPMGVTTIGNRAFSGCTGLASANIPNSVTTIGKDAFRDCNKLTTLHIENLENWINIKREGDIGIPSNTILFVNGLKFTELVVPNSITSIGKYAFYNYQSLESITFHKDVSVIVQNAFNGCTNVKKMVCQGDTPPVCGADALTGISRTECTLYVPETSGSNYRNTAPWSEFTNIVGGGTETPDTPGTCGTPTITFDNNTKQLKFESATEGAEYHCTVTCDDMMTDKVVDGVTQMTGIYTVTAYSSADGMYNSEKVTVKLLWVNAVIDAGTTDVLSAKTQRGVIVSTCDGNICVSGTVGGEIIEICNAAGSLLCSVKAAEGSTTVGGLAKHSAYIVKIGGTSVKVVL